MSTATFSESETFQHFLLQTPSSDPAGSDVHRGQGLTSVDIGLLAEEYDHGVATYRIETREQLTNLLTFVKPALEKRGVRVAVRTQNEKIKQALRSDGNLQRAGARPAFLVSGAPQTSIDSGQKDTGLQVNPRERELVRKFNHVPGKALMREGIVTARTIAPSGVDLESLRQSLASGTVTPLRIEDVHALDEETLKGFFRLKHQYKDLFQLHGVQKQGEDLKRRWSEIGAIVRCEDAERAKEVMPPPVAVANPVPAPVKSQGFFARALSKARGWFGK